MRPLTKLWSRLFPNPRYYGWAVVGLGFLASALTSPGQSFAISLYLEPVMGELSLSRVEISSLYALATLGAAACLPFLGGVADRVPTGRFLATIMVLIGMALVGFASVQTAFALGMVLFALRLLGQGAVGLGTLTATVRWFRRYRGRALAVVGLGFAFGQLLFPGVILGSIGWLGWRGSLLAMAAVYLLVAAPVFARFLRERRHDDDPIDGSSVGGVDGDAGSEPEESFSLQATLRTPVFWGLLASVSIPPLVHTAVIFHQVTLFTSAGWSVALIPPSFAGFAMASVVLTYATGLLLERTGGRVGIMMSLGFSAVALIAALNPAPGAAGAMLYGGLLGMASGAHSAANSIVWPEYFGIEALGAVKGVVNGVRNGASAIGPPLAALLMDGTDSLGRALLLFVVLCAVGAVGAGWLRRP